MLLINIYFVEAESDSNTSNFISEIVPFIKEELEYHYKEFNYKIVVNETRLSKSVGPDEYIFIFNLDGSTANYQYLSLMKHSEMPELYKEIESIVKRTISLFIKRKSEGINND